MMSYSVPREIYYGEGSLEKLAGLKGKKAALVTGGSSMKRFGFIDKVTAILKKGGIEAILIDGVEPNPSVATVKRGAKAMLDFKPDWIIAIGGGSAIDAAKVMWCFYEHPEVTFEQLLPVGSMPALRNKAKFIAIPSTSGTASEITAFSVITDPENHIKYPLVSGEMVPDMAILDPDLPRTMPPHITANTGMDVMCHALEALVSTAATPFTDPYALEAIRLVTDNLPTAYAKGDDLDARLKMHEASALAGMAFTNASLGLVHSLAHKIGGEFGVTHGLANAILLPYIIAYNKQFTDKYAFGEKQLRIPDFAKNVEEINAKVGIPTNFKDCKEVAITPEKFEAVLDRMSQHAFEDPCTLTNPGHPTVADVKMIYKAAYYGTPITLQK
ncbi:MAG: iron-containing alcohol dehydrogenase [Spirochaetia bacterium]|nr:iron-containing alcohol dehydrogenase [Spirochaetia bacterium]